MNAEQILATGLVPDSLIRFFIRKRLRQKLRQEAQAHEDLQYEKHFIALLSEGPIAIQTQAANQQHYEVPAAFFQKVLGKQLKYSAALWEEGVSTLDEAEERMFALYVQRANIQDGQTILDLGCGWGSLCLYLAKHFPRAKILAISNSASQRVFIETQALSRNFKNLSVMTADINTLSLLQKFDRILSIEMFEHMRNYQTLLKQISSWLNPDGYLFVHIFCHRDYAYFFNDNGPHDWMGRYFFTGGLMPAFHTLSQFHETLYVHRQWEVNGRHYEKTANAWLVKMDQAKAAIFPVFQETYGKDAGKWWHYWRVFFMACAELFGYKNGEEWLVGHYLLKKSETPQPHNATVWHGGAS